jgi:hypothetical protein
MVYLNSFLNLFIKNETYYYLINISKENWYLRTGLCFVMHTILIKIVMHFVKCFSLVCIMFFVSCKSPELKVLKKECFTSDAFVVYYEEPQYAAFGPHTIVIAVSDLVSGGQELQVLRDDLKNDGANLSANNIIITEDSNRVYKIEFKGAEQEELFYRIEYKEDTKGYIVSRSTVSIIKNAEDVDESLNVEIQAMEGCEKIIEVWREKEFKPYLIKNNFIQDCLICGSISMDIKIYVDENGKCTSVEVLNKEIDCRKTEEEKQKLEKEMIESFKKNVFPDLFREKYIELKIGNPTKC